MEVENNSLSKGSPQKYTERYKECSGDAGCEQQIRKDMAKESAENVLKLKSCWESGDTACVVQLGAQIELNEQVYTALRVQDDLAGRAYESSAKWYADIIEQCAGKCGWLEASLLKAGADGLGNLVYGALGAGGLSNEKLNSATKPEQSAGKGTPAQNENWNALNEASKTAFDAAKNNVASWTPKDKHMVGTTANRSAQFNTSDISDIQHLVKKALNSPSAKFIPNNVDGSLG
ncbi:hypothetical protein SNC47_12835 [Escherichia coli]|nr:hypothetical protein [Escherichia coli]